MRAVSAVLLGLAAHAAAQSYDQDAAIDLVYYAGLAYCDLGELQSWSCGSACDSHPVSSQVFVQQNASTFTQSYVTTRQDTGNALLSFRGTIPSSWTDWLKDNLDAFHISPFPNCPACKVHQGFYDAYMSLKPQIVYALQQLGASQVQVTGHSLGAAMAAVAMYDLTQDGYEVLHSATFGQPRMGDVNFANSWDDILGSELIWRVTHWRDPVPHVPLEAMDYHHMPTEVWYTEDNTDYSVCNGSGEDPNCSDSLDFDTDISDHLDYIGIHLTSLCGASSDDATDVAEDAPNARLRGR